VKGLKIFHANSNQEKAEWLYIYQLKQTSRQNSQKRQIRLSFNDKGVNSSKGYSNCMCLYPLNIEGSKYTKQILTDIKGEIYGNTKVGDFNTLF
jgi:hypothetical protein